MTNPPPPTCPECGAIHVQIDGSTMYRCDSIHSDNHPEEIQWQSPACRIASLTRQLAERDEELRMVRADNAALIYTYLCDCKYTEMQCEFCEEYRSNPHPGQPLLDKLSRLERVAEAARTMLKAIDEASLYDDQPSTSACDELENALAALEVPHTEES